MLTTFIAFFSMSTDWSPARSSQEVVQTLESRFGLPGGFYREKIKFGEPPATSFLWGTAVTLAAFSQGLALDKSGYSSRWASLTRALDRYWTAGNPGGYAVLPDQKGKPDRYYDDNAWVAWACYEAYEVTQDPADLARADKAYQFALSGRNDDLGGGIFWRESDKASKNACVNAPMAAVSFLRYKRTRDPADLRTGDELLAWTRGHLQDEDGLVMDNLDLKGKVERTKWTYNTSCFVRALVIRYGLTKDEADRAEAERILDASLKRWVNPQTSLVKDPSMFAQHLVDALFEAGLRFGEPRYTTAAMNIVESVSRTCMTSDGLAGERWDGPPSSDGASELLYESSVLRVLLSAQVYSVSRP